jgi:hypothetical protein
MKGVVPAHDEASQNKMDEPVVADLSHESILRRVVRP